MIATITSFRYSDEYLLLSARTEGADAHNVNLCAGNKADYPLRDMIAMKGLKVEFEDTGKTVVVGGRDIKRYSFKGWVF